MDTSLPSDIIQLLVIRSSLGTVNSLARSCTAVADFVREHAGRLATPHLSERRPTHLNKMFVTQLPNGTRHGHTRIIFSEQKHIAVDYHFGTIIYWKARSYNTTLWGKTGSPYILECNDHDFNELRCNIVVDVGIDFYISQNVTGRRGHWWDTLETSPLKGYIVDDKIQHDVIDTWMKKIFALMDRSVAPEDKISDMPPRSAKYHIFNQAKTTILRAEFGLYFDNLIDDTH